MKKALSGALASVLVLSTALPTTLAETTTSVEVQSVQVEAEPTVQETITNESTSLPAVEEAKNTTTSLPVVEEATNTTTVPATTVKEQVAPTSTVEEEPVVVTPEVKTPTTTTLPITQNEVVEETTPSTVTIVPGDHVAVAQKLIDIPNDFWAKNEVMQLVEQGVIGGYPDGEFRPALDINRGQAANLFAGALELPNATYQAKFKDVSEKSGFLQGVFSTYAAGIFGGKPDGRFGVADALTREQMATTLVRAFNLKDTGKALTFKDWDKISESHRENVKILAQHGITTGREDGTYDPKATVNRVTFTVMLYRSLVATGKMEANSYTIQPAAVSKNFEINRKQTNFVQVTSSPSPLYLRTEATISSKGTTTESFGIATDTVHNYAVGSQGATVKVTVRKFVNGDEFIFTTLNNPSAAAVTVDVFEKQTNVTNHRLYRYDQHPIKKNDADVFGHDSSTYPTGLLRTMSDGRLAKDRMVGQAYRSAQLTQSYTDTNGKSYMRDLESEYEAISTAVLGTDLLSVYTLASKGDDMVDMWFMDSKERLFTTDVSMNAWMLETAQNYKKRNNWYTADGPYNKMATTTEPMPKSGQGFGRNLLLVKEDRALVLFKEQGDRYFANLVKNSFVSLAKFKGNDKYWETEVTSTYLKNLYGVTAPFIDTRFNEQIALFYYNSGQEFGMPNFKQPLKNYADLLVSRKEAGHIIPVNSNAYYISDYFPINQQVTPHSSMNHLLGGLNILLMAYNEFGDEKYLQTANSIQNALTIEKNKWIRANGDLWYRLNAKGEFAGTDYQHLTLEDLINTYTLWKDIDATKLPVIEEMIASKAGYLSTNNFGYTIKIKNGLEALGMLKYLPLGPQYTDAL
ncbi:MAG: S-layer homology domain-containing protein [Solibacillus sp.]